MTNPHQTDSNLSCRCHLSLSLSQINNLSESHSPLSNIVVTSPPHTQALLIPLQALIFNTTTLTSFDLQYIFLAFWTFDMFLWVLIFVVTKFWFFVGSIWSMFDNLWSVGLNLWVYLSFDLWVLIFVVAESLIC